MMLNDFLFADAGWFFFAVLSIVVGAVSLTAFAQDLLPSKVHANSPSRNSSSPELPTNTSKQL